MELRKKEMTAQVRNKVWGSQFLPMPADVFVRGFVGVVVSPCFSLLSNKRRAVHLLRLVYVCRDRAALLGACAVDVDNVLSNVIIKKLFGTCVVFRLMPRRHVVDWVLLLAVERAINSQYMLRACGNTTGGARAAPRLVQRSTDWWEQIEQGG